MKKRSTGIIINKMVELKEKDCENIIKKVIGIINARKKDDASFQETLRSIQDIFPSRIIYQDQEYKTSKQKREYAEMKREQAKEEKKLKKREDQRQFKIDNALKRITFYCYSCNESVKVIDVDKNVCKIKEKRNRIENSIIISNECPKCNKEVKGFGGYVA